MYIVSEQRGAFELHSWQRQGVLQQVHFKWILFQCHWSAVLSMHWVLWSLSWEHWTTVHIITYWCSYWRQRVVALQSVVFTTVWQFDPWEECNIWYQPISRVYQPISCVGRVGNKEVQLFLGHSLYCANMWCGVISSSYNHCFALALQKRKREEIIQIITTKPFVLLAWCNFIHRYVNLLKCLWTKNFFCTFW